MTETRSLTVPDIRTKGRKLFGYAALFDTETRIGDAFTEVIRPGAFAATLREREDILALMDHSPGKVIARTKSGTLSLAEDDTGLVFEVDVPDTQAGRDLLVMVERGDLGGMSFGFIAEDEKVEGERREILAVELIEISFVSAFPAYEGTTLNARSGGAQIDHSLVRRIQILELGG